MAHKDITNGARSRIHLLEKCEGIYWSVLAGFQGTAKERSEMEAGGFFDPSG